jgi:hypothetical protein
MPILLRERGDIGVFGRPRQSRVEVNATEVTP